MTPRAVKIIRMWNSRSLSAWQDRYYSLNSRERSAIMLGVSAVLIFSLFQFLIFPMSHKRSGLELSIISKEDDLLKLKGIVAQYRQLVANTKVGKGKTRGEASGPFSLFSFLEEMAAKSRLMDKIDYMKPGSVYLDGLREENWVEVKLSRITLKEMTSYLYNLQSRGKNVYIKRLSARKDGEYLTLILQPAVTEKGSFRREAASKWRITKTIG